MSSDTDPFDQLDPLNPVEAAILDRFPWKPVDEAATGVVIAYGDPDDPL